MESCLCLNLYGCHKLLHFQDEVTLGYISIRVSDSADISGHTESQECAKWDQERFPKSASQTLSCTSALEGRYVSIQRTDGENTHNMILCEVLIMGVIDSTSPCMFRPNTSSSYNIFPQAVIENKSYSFWSRQFFYIHYKCIYDLLQTLTALGAKTLTLNAQQQQHVVSVTMAGGHQTVKLVGNQVSVFTPEN